jgi:hypothetical protein
MLVVLKVVMSNNVVDDNNDVNVYFCRYGPEAMTERPYHHGNLRTALLTQAERTVRERGVKELSLRELARDVGVSHAAPRRHFPDRRGFPGPARSHRHGLHPLRHPRSRSARADVRL